MAQPAAAEVRHFSIDLTQQERMQLISILPQQGDIATVRVIRMLRDSLNLKPEERPRVSAPGVPQMAPTPIAAKTFSFTAQTRRIIVEQFTILDKQKKLPVDYLDLYDKFMEDDRGETDRVQ